MLNLFDYSNCKNQIKNLIYIMNENQTIMSRLELFFCIFDGYEVKGKKTYNKIVDKYRRLYRMSFLKLNRYSISLVKRVCLFLNSKKFIFLIKYLKKVSNLKRSI